jgi:hypothetical protein
LTKSINPIYINSTLEMTNCNIISTLRDVPSGARKWKIIFSMDQSNPLFDEFTKPFNTIMSSTITICTQLQEKVSVK